MFRLRDLKNGLFQIHKSNGPAYEGTPRSIFDAAIKMGVIEKELVHAVNQLDLRSDDYADFRSDGHLMFTRRNS